MNEYRYLTPPEFNRQANDRLLSYERDRQRLMGMKDEYGALETILENAVYLHETVRDGIRACLEQQGEIILGLEDNVNILRQWLAEMGVEVA